VKRKKYNKCKNMQLRSVQCGISISCCAQMAAENNEEIMLEESPTSMPKNAALRARL
jgi:hypothetical protein